MSGGLGLTETEKEKGEREGEGENESEREIERERERKREEEGERKMPSTCNGTMKKTGLALPPPYVGVSLGILNTELMTLLLWNQIN